MTAAVVTAVRVPAQAGPPAAEVDQGALDRWALVRAAQAGDREAFGQLYAHYQAMVLRVIRNRVSVQALAEDLAGEVWLRALRNIDRVTWQGRDFGAWLTTIARNIVVDHYKSGRGRLETLTADVLDADAIDRTREGDPASAAVDYLINRQLLAAVTQLGAEQKECVRLRFLLGLSLAETARAMGKNESAIKALQYRAMRSLARLLPADLMTSGADR